MVPCQDLWQTQTLLLLAMQFESAINGLVKINMVGQHKPCLWESSVKAGQYLPRGWIQCEHFNSV